MGESPTRPYIRQCQMKTLTFALCIACLTFALGIMFNPLKSLGEDPNRSLLPREIISPLDGAPMVLIPAGEFLRGSTEAQIEEVLRLDPSLAIKPFKFKAEQPVRQICLDAYYIDKYEVTVGQYRKFIKATGYPEPNWETIRYFSPTDAHPIIMVSWEDAMAYAEWAKKSLPTEAQWEKAACGGLEGKMYPWGDNLSHDYANYLGVGGRDQWEESTSPVGSFPPNGYGVYDMAGNVMEWVFDWYDPFYYQQSPKENPVNLTPSPFRILRGGAWCLADDDLRCAGRWMSDVVFRGGDREGFRCALNVNQRERLGTSWASVKKTWLSKSY